MSEMTMFNTTRTVCVMLALAVGGCAHDEEENASARTSHSSGAEERPQQSAARDADGDDIDDDADEAIDESRRRDAQRAPQPVEAAAPAPAPATTSSQGTQPAPAQSASQSATPAASGDVPTAQDQPVGNSDEDITRRIRQHVVADDSLSMAARNITIVTRSGVVTLRGSLSAREESATIETYARSVSGVRRVDNRISVRN